MLLVMLLRFFINDLAYNIVTLKSSVHVRLVVQKWKTDADIKEVIGLYVLPMFIFIPYYEPSPPSW